MSITLEELGLTQDQIQDRVVAALCRAALHTKTFDEDGDECTISTDLKRRLDKVVEEGIDTAVQNLADKEVLPNVSEYIENLTLQATNKWGENKGESLSFTEYLVQRAEAYMQEKVDFQGATKGECYGSSFRGAQTRLTYMIEKHLHYSIETAMKKVLADGNSAIVEGLEKTIKIQLDAISKKLSVKVDTGR